MPAPTSLRADVRPMPVAGLRSPASAMLILGGLLLFALMLSSLGAAALTHLLTGEQLATLLTRAGGPLQDPQGGTPSTLGNQTLFIVLIAQGIVSLGGFVGAGWAYVRLIEQQPLSILSPGVSGRVGRAPGGLLALAALTLVVALPMIDAVGALNRALHLPEALAGLEQWIRNQEASLEATTAALTSFNTPLEFALGVVVMAAIPALGEELIFRGLLQPILHRATGNAHVGIWLSAAVFSAIHIQFLGFLPRWLLGGMFGYLYLASGHFAVPVIAHFVNNALLITLLYLGRIGVIDPAFLEPTETSPGWVATSVLGTGVVLWMFFRAAGSETPSLDAKAISKSDKTDPL